MPCRDYMDEQTTGTQTVHVENPINNTLKRRCNLLSKLLCYILTDIIKNAPRTYARLLRDEELNEWWTAHQIADNKEEKRKKQNRDRRILDNKISESLTELEIKIRKNPNKYYHNK